MIYLLDVNVLLAVSYRWHNLHSRADQWLTDLQVANSPVRLATCSITELGLYELRAARPGLRTM
ncbi:MAG: hypothetical protein ACJ8R9_09975 [Steroidobacteraceae bacterium]